MGSEMCIRDSDMAEALALGDRLLALGTDIGRDISSALLDGRRVLLEGAQGTALDLDHGTYPFVTSSNTTAAAAVVAASRHVSLEDRKALVLGSTGSVGRRVARLFARKGAEVRVASRDVARATEVAEEIRGSVDGVRIQPFATGEVDGLRAALDGVEVVVAAGGPGVELLSLEERERLAAQPMGHSLRVLIDLNAVPPVGIAGIEPTDAAVERDGVTTYGAIGVGGTKMKIHKAAVARLFEANDLVLDAEEVLDIGLAL